MSHSQNVAWLVTWVSKSNGKLGPLPVNNWWLIWRKCDFFSASRLYLAYSGVGLSVKVKTLRSPFPLKSLRGIGFLMAEHNASISIIIKYLISSSGQVTFIGDDNQLLFVDRLPLSDSPYRPKPVTAISQESARSLDVQWMWHTCSTKFTTESTQSKRPLAPWHDRDIQVLLSQWIPPTLCT